LRFLLGENFPLLLHRRLIAAGHDSEHIIAAGQRGLPDAQIVQRLLAEDDLIFLTEGTEFLDVKEPAGATIVSRVAQALPIQRRIEIWFSALEDYVRDPPNGHLFELLASGKIVAWELKS
jgi:hypothetical protein